MCEGEIGAARAGRRAREASGEAPATNAPMARGPASRAEEAAGIFLPRRPHTLLLLLPRLIHPSSSRIPPNPRLVGAEASFSGGGGGGDGRREGGGRGVDVWARSRALAASFSDGGSGRRGGGCEGAGAGGGSRGGGRGRGGGGRRGGGRGRGGGEW